MAKTDHLAASFKNAVTDYIKFFKGNESSFKGHLKTYTQKEGTVDEPNMRGSVNVVTTVKEKLDWLSETSKDYIDALFSQEATNASGLTTAQLWVDGVDFGKYSSGELLRLKSIISNQDFRNMYATIPVREETKNWVKTAAEQYVNREVWQDEILRGIKRTTEKEDYILIDPNLDKLGAGAKYTPMVANRTKSVDIGDYTAQNFTGQASHRERAEILRRMTSLLTAIQVAIKECNDIEAVPSEMTSDKLFGYLHNGKF